MQKGTYSAFVGTLGIAAALILGGAGCSSDDSAGVKITSPAVSPVANYVAYDIPDFSMKLQYPKDWEKEETKEDGGSVVQLMAPYENEDDQYRDNITILKYDVGNPADNNLDSFVKFAQDGLKTVSEDIVFTDAGSFTIGGAPAKKASATGTMRDGNKYKWMQYYVVANNKGYVFTFTDDPSSFSSNLPTADKIMGTVELR